MPVHRLFFPLCLSHHTVALGNAALQKSKKRKASNLMASVTPRFSATSCSPRALLVRSSLLPGRLYPTAIILSAKKFTVRLLSTIFIGYVSAGVVPLLFFYFSHPFPSVCLFELANREIKPRNEEARLADKLSVAGVWIWSFFRTKKPLLLPLTCSKVFAFVFVGKILCRPETSYFISVITFMSFVSDYRYL